MSLDYKIIDFDNHYYEPDDCCTRHMPAKQRDRAVNIRRGADGLGRVYIGDEPYKFFRVTLIDHISAPGSMRKYFEGKELKSGTASGAAQDSMIDVTDYPEFMDAQRRLSVMDDQGIQACVMLPSLFVSVIQGIVLDVDTAYANLEAFNRWVEDDWGYARTDRVFGAPMMLLLDPERAVAELDRVLADGARIIGMVPGPLGDRSPADPIFDPFWSRLEEAGVPLAFHVGDAGFQRLYGVHWGEDPDVPSHHFSPLQNFLAITDRPIVDSLAAMLLQNLWGRFPKLQVVSIENGSAWVPELLKRVDKAWRSNPRGKTIGGVIANPPSETFRTNISVVPFAEEDVPKLVDHIGERRVLMGSDYPHPEGLETPADFAKLVDGLGDEAERLIMRDNAVSLLKLGAG